MNIRIMRSGLFAAVAAGIVAFGAQATEVVVRSGWKAETTASIDNAADYPMWRNADLRKLTNFTCYFTGASVSGSYRGYVFGWFPRWISDTELEVQFQLSEGGSLLKCVAVRFFQHGDDVYARRNFTDYASGSGLAAGGRDFYSQKGSSHVNTSDGYQATQIACCVKTDDGKVPVLQRAKNVKIGERVAIEGAPAVHQAVVPIPLKPEVKWRVEEDDPSKIVMYPCLMWRNTPIKAVDNFVATTCGANIGTYTNVRGYFPHWLSDTEVVVQFQKKDGSFVKCELIKFFQHGDDVYAETYLKMYSFDTSEGVRDFFVDPSNSSGNASGYDIKEVKADIREFEVETEDYAETIDIPSGGFEEAPLTWMGSGRYADSWKVTLNVASCGDEKGEYELVAWGGGINPSNVIFGQTPKGGSFFFSDASGNRYATAESIPQDVTVTGVGYRQTKFGLLIIVH